MRTRSRSRHKIAEPLQIEFHSQEDQFQEDPPEVPMAENRTMAQLLQAPTVGYEDAIVIPEIAAMNFELKHGFIELSCGWNFLDKMPSGCLKIIESKSKVRQSRANAVVAKVNSSSSTPAISSDVAELKDMVRALLLDKKNQSSAPASSPIPAPVKAVESNCVTCSGTHSYQNCPATSENVYQDNIQDFEEYSKPGSKHAKPVSKYTKPVSNCVKPVGQSDEYDVQIHEFQYGFIFRVRDTPCAPMPNLKPSIPYPSRHDNERRSEQANEQIEEFYEIFKDMSFDISFTDALILMPKFASTLKALIRNKEKLSEMARTPMNEHCSAVILNKFPKKLRDPGKFLIPCKFLGMDECLALADLGASINLMPLSMWKELALPELTPTYMTLELADRLVSKLISIAKDVKVKVGMFHFPADFMVVDFKPDPRVPLILGRYFLKTGRALTDVHKGELTLRIGNEAITYNLDQTSRYLANYDQITANKIDVTDEACEEYSQEVLGFSDVTVSGRPTPSDDLIISTTSPTLTPFGDSDFLLFEEANAFLDPSYYDPEKDILMLEAILNSDPAPSLPNHEQSVPSFKNEVKACEAKTIKSSIDEPPEVELKDLPPHLEYAFLEGDNKLPVIIAKELEDKEKADLIKVLKSHKRAIAWKLSDIHGINPKFCTHKIIMEEDYKPVVQHQRRVNPKIHDVIKKKVEKLLDAGLIYPISDSPWASPVHCVPKKGGFTVVKNEENELIPTRLVTGWRVCIDYQKLNEATRKDHVPLPFMDQMLERLAGNEYYCFLDGFSGYFQIPIDPRDQEKTTFTALMERSLTVACLSVYAMRWERFKGVCWLSFTTWLKRRWKSLWTTSRSLRVLSKPVSLELSLPELTPTCMTLELADRSVSKPIGISKDIKVKVGMFHFPADFVVVDFEPDPRVPLILGRCFLKTGRALIDVHKGELTLRIRNEAITYNLDQTSRYSANYDQMTANKIDVTDNACEEYFQEVIGFSNVTASGSPTPSNDPIVSTTSPTLTPFGDSDFLLFKEANAFLGLEDDPDLLELDPSYYDPEGDIQMLEAILNSDPAPSLPNHEQSVPSFTNELKACEAKMIKSSVDEPPEVELKDLPPHLKYAFLEDDNKFPVIIAKELGEEEKAALIKVLKSHKRAIAWKLSDIQGINPEFCTHKILMEEDYKPAVQHQRSVNPKIHDVIKKE
nr:reverse transcriptase domain-containing protein [Tanacetum cinerariifolium]